MNYVGEHNCKGAVSGMPLLMPVTGGRGATRASDNDQTSRACK